MTANWRQWEGQVVNGKFPLRQYLGGGERSAVFLTEFGEQQHRKAAIKLILADPADGELQLSRWHLASKLSHSHLIQLFQFGRWQLDNLGLLYVVMEYAEEDLSQILPDRPLTPAETLEMLEPVLDVLAYLHGAGFLHRHIKPANIMAVNDHLKISSDGLCQSGEGNGLGATGIYDPPEIADGKLSAAGDVWSLGTTLVEVLTQRLPVWERTKSAEPILPETMPAPFLDLARHCLRRDPQGRWTVTEIAARLRQHSPSLQQTTAKPREIFAKWRNALLAGAVVLALATMLAGPRLFHRRPQAQRATSIAFREPTAEPRPKPTQRVSNGEQGSNSAAALSSKARPPTGGLIPGEIVHQVLPDVPQKARNTIRGKVRVRVRVRVDAAGSVVETKFDSSGPSEYFARLALSAAQRWKFRPAKVDGRGVSSEWTLAFEFSRDDTKVLSLQVAH